MRDLLWYKVTYTSSRIVYWLWVPYLNRSYRYVRFSMNDSNETTEYSTAGFSRTEIENWIYDMELDFNNVAKVESVSPINFYKF